MAMLADRFASQALVVADEERYFFLIISSCDIGYLKVEKLKNRNRKDKKNKMGAAAKGNIRRRILWENLTSFLT